MSGDKHVLLCLMLNMMTIEISPQTIIVVGYWPNVER